MCGLAGILTPDAARGRAAVKAMNRALAHRGPDGEGLHEGALGDYAVVLGHRRLAIQDLSQAAGQPMTHEPSGNVIVYNGELYNVVELRASLEARGHRFRTHSDTELILAAFAEWGLRCFERFAGMYAFALLTKDRLVLARDPLGIKPLYLSRAGEHTLFASEVSGLEASGLVATELSMEGLRSALAFGAVVGPNTILSAVREVEPGCALELWPQEAPRATRFYVTPRARQAFGGEDRDLLATLLSRAVSQHLVSDVPVGVFLSAGLDSTAIAMLAAPHQRNLGAFTVEFLPGHSQDETPIARATARSLELSHSSLALSSAQICDRVAEFFHAGDQPGVDGLNTYLVAGEVRRLGTVVALSGLGGDELLGGYDTFRVSPFLATARRFLPSALPVASLARLASGFFRGAHSARKAQAFVEARAELLAMYLLQRRLFLPKELGALGLRSEGDDLPVSLDLRGTLDASDHFASVRSLELNLYMRSVLLRDSDVYGMAHGLEIRVPMLDQRVVDFLLTRTREGLPRQGKQWLVDALEGQWPRDVLSRRKTGFSLPYARWMLGPLRDTFQQYIRLAEEVPFLDPEGVRACWREFEADPRGGAWARPWMLASLGAWLRRRRERAARLAQ